MFSLNTSGLGSQVGEVFTGFGGMIILIGGIGLAFVAVPKVISWLKGSSRTTMYYPSGGMKRVMKGTGSNYINGRTSSFKFKKR